MNVIIKLNCKKLLFLCILIVATLKLKSEFVKNKNETSEEKLEHVSTRLVGIVFTEHEI